ncbi:ArsR family transcriptional regulator [Arthrobacter sp. MYb23]|uniref:arsenate reductase/protein-tyrosine-phosphatase family protein n=1 Tax=unclassified Arthrobacter TaxID=235627 RepID=UPI000CFDCD3B|nr:MULTISPECIES: helix-turn-helix domain-containing protein [unclassified Arthrobacter]PRB42112.1 ArsR family transcriptional regulator [Arthrobacter sp. MYb51]PRB95188.1 ArsR family transcriptional regulator [Arthrobacter sp. MYb23]
MDIEQAPSLLERAAKYAALADPARLRIVDLLTLGDLSPTELQSELGMPANLLSHHLRSMEDAGLAVRHRSEADRRRSYVRLAPAALEGLIPGRERGARRVLFVCTRNSARSQLATALWQTASDIPSASAGTHPAEHVAPGAVDVAFRHGLDLEGCKPRLIDQVAREEDLLITVCDNAHEELPGLRGIHWSIPDPVRLNSKEAFEDAFADISRRVHDLAPRLSAA